MADQISKLQAIDLASLGQSPSWVKALVAISAGIGISAAALLTRARKRGRRRSPRARGTTGAERLMLAAALVPSIIVWWAVLAVSLIGLTGFARDTMRWDHWTNLLVPLSLDGISVSFGGWAFVAVKRRRHPGRAYKVVLAAAAASATLNFVHGRDTWSIWAGAYLAFLSLAAMAMFHEMLDQFMTDVSEEIPQRSRYPRFGQRWLYAPVSTLKARWAWIVYPPEDSLMPTIRNALRHSQAVHTLIRRRRRQEPSSSVNGHRAWSAADLVSPRKEHVPFIGLTPSGVVTDEMLVLSAEQNGEANIADDTQLNRLAELLWIDFARKGKTLSGPELLEKVQQLYGVSRTRRWANYRRSKAMHSWHDTNHPGELG